MGWLDDILGDPTKRAGLMAGLGMIGNASAGVPLGQNMMRSGIAGIDAYDQVASQKKEEENQRKREAREIADMERRNKVADAQLKQIEREMSAKDKEEKFRERAANVAGNLPQWAEKDPAYATKVADRLMQEGLINGVEVEAVMPYTTHGRRGLAQQEEAHSMDMQTARMGIAADQQKNAYYKFRMGAEEEDRRMALEDRQQAREDKQMLREPARGVSIPMPNGGSIMGIREGGKTDVLPSDYPITPPQDDSLTRRAPVDVGQEAKAETVVEKYKKFLGADDEFLATPGRRRADQQVNVQQALMELQQAYPLLNDDYRAEAKELIKELQRRTRR